MSIVEKRTPFVGSGVCGALAVVLAVSLTMAVPTSAQDYEIGGELGEVRVDLPTDGTTPSFWLLKLRPQAVRMVTPQAGPGKGEIFWYMLYTVENRADEDRQVLISITAESDRGARYTDMYLPFVEKAIEKKEKQLLWGKADEFKALTDRDLGEPDFAFMRLAAGQQRRSVAVFNRLDRNANHVKIRVRGLSNEIRRREGPEGVVLEEQVLELTFRRSGDEFGVTQDSFYPAGSEWVTESVSLSGATEETSP